LKRQAKELEEKTSPRDSPRDSPKIEDKSEDEDFGDLTDAEQIEKEKLLQEGFGIWSKRDFWAFITACSRYGRKEYSLIATDIGTKTEKEVKEYASAFWKRHGEIADIDGKIKSIEKGELKLQRLDDSKIALDTKVARYKNPLTQMKFSYGPQKAKLYIEEEDVFLVYKAQQLGYGNWEDLQNEIRKAHQFRFDWFLKSRSPQDLNKRVDQLIRIIEKENLELDKKKNKSSPTKDTAKEKPKKKKKIAEPTSLSKRRKTPSDGAITSPVPESEEPVTKKLKIDLSEEKMEIELNLKEEGNCKNFNINLN